MPVPDEFKIAPDFFVCEFCNKGYPDTERRTALFRIKDTDNVGRAYYICNTCFQKAQDDKSFDDEITAKVFRENLGRKVRIKDVH